MDLNPLSEFPKIRITVHRYPDTTELVLNAPMPDELFSDLPPDFLSGLAAACPAFPIENFQFVIENHRSDEEGDSISAHDAEEYSEECREHGQAWQEWADRQTSRAAIRIGLAIAQAHQRTAELMAEYKELLESGQCTP